MTAPDSKLDDAGAFKRYFAELMKIRLSGRIYKKLYVSPILFFCARRFGKRVLEVGCGIGSGVLGTFPGQVEGVDVNPYAVEYCNARGLKARLIRDDGSYPSEDAIFDCCVLDNVLEHIGEQARTLAECHRITAENGGLVVVVPGKRGYASDSDHKKFYDAQKLRALGGGWQLQSLFSLPLLFCSERMSRTLRQYCLVAIYRKLPTAGGVVAIATMEEGA